MSNPCLTDEEQRIIDNLRPFAKKAKRLGWTRPEGLDDILMYPDGSIELSLYDHHGNRHWFRANSQGQIWALPSTLTIKGEAIF